MNWWPIMRRMALAAALSAAFGGACLAEAGKVTWLETDPAVVTLRGFIVKKLFYGPPEFGEEPKTDHKAGNLLLLLPEPINVRDPEKDNSGFVDVRQITVASIMSKDAKAILNQLQRYLGREVEITGTLYEGRTGWYWATFGIDVQKVTLVPRSARLRDPNNGRPAEEDRQTGQNTPAR